VGDDDRFIAFDWFRKTAESGYGAAQNELALAYQYGLGTLYVQYELYYGLQNQQL
jgi:TPR repeat protein